MMKLFHLFINNLFGNQLLRLCRKDFNLSAENSCHPSPVTRYFSLYALRSTLYALAGLLRSTFFMCLVSCVLCLISTSPASANNLSISNVSLEDRDADADTVVVEFDISWDHSWRDDINYDAAWVFIKACEDDCATEGWEHAKLSKAGTDPDGTSAGSEQDPQIEIYIPTDKVGAFIRPNAAHTGTITASNVRLSVDYSSFGAADTDLIQLKVFGIEMVYIPDGDFYIGDGDGTNESTSAFHYNTGNTAQQVTSDLLSDVRVDSNSYDDSQIEDTGIGIDGDGGLDVDDDGDIDDADNSLFPTGGRGFYLMKYELSQAQYRDFLNTLAQAQQNNRVAATLSDEAAGGEFVMATDGATSVSTRNTIAAGSDPNDGAPYTFGCDLNENGTFNEFNDGEWIAMNYMSWMDVAAYADWAGLRPMTELEFERAARGPMSPVYGEYAWGSTDITQIEDTIQDAGQNSETATTTGNGLANYNGVATDIDGPLRVGFAADSSSTRLQAGAGYYGNMNLSDNLYELIVTVGNSTGRAFEGTHGDGTLTTTSSYEGNATNDDWPGIDGTVARGVTGGIGCGIRGTSWWGSSRTVSNRQNATIGIDVRTGTLGSCLARTAKQLATVMYVSSAITDGDLSAYGDDARDGADTFCAANKPSNLPEECSNIKALVAITSSDEIQDFPAQYGFQSDTPIYWWHNTNQVFNKAADNWDDLLDGTIDMAGADGTGISTSAWTASSSTGQNASPLDCMGFTSNSGSEFGYVGDSNESGFEWLSSLGIPQCSSTERLYCVCQYEVP